VQSSTKADAVPKHAKLDHFWSSYVVPSPGWAHATMVNTTATDTPAMPCPPMTAWEYRCGNCAARPKTPLCSTAMKDPAATQVAVGGGQ
jgi:hypothetical protein